MTRFDAEFRLVGTRFAAAEANGSWILIREYPLPSGWNFSDTDVAFQVVAAPAAPYGVYVRRGLRFNNQLPSNYSDSASGVPFPGEWAVFSWYPAEGQWVPAEEVTKGSNYLNWAMGIADRFREGV